MYVGTAAFSECGGCHTSLFLNGEQVIALLCDHNISFSTYLVDQRSISPCDVVVVMGGLRNTEELEIAGEISRTARKVIAAGSCAVYGGLLGAGTVRSPHETQGLPGLLENVQPVDTVMNVEIYLPGCPPPPAMMLEAVKSVLEGYVHPTYDGTVCSECSRSVEHRAVRNWNTHPGSGVPSTSCLLNRGFLCLGPVTRSGCKAVCTVRGAACIGCRGPSAMVLSSQLHSLFGDMVKFVSLSTGTKEKKTAEQLMAMLRSIYLFVNRDPVTRGRAGEMVPGV